MAAIGFAKQIAGNPLWVLAQDLVIDVFEQIELNRLAGPIGWLNAVDDHATHAADEVAVEECDRGSQTRVQLGLPVTPIIPIEIPSRDAAAVVVEDVQIIGYGGVKKAINIHLPLGVQRC